MRTSLHWPALLAVAVCLTAAARLIAPTADMKAVLDAHAALGPKPLPTLTPPEARQQPTPADAVAALLKSKGRSAAPDSSVESRDRMIPGRGGEMQVRIFTPKNASGPLPLVVYYHGGGWVIADRVVYDAGARAISKHANAVVMSVDYRLAPEAKFPAAHDDALAAYRWALANAGELNADPGMVGLAGESAGGNLAVATAVAARDAKLQQPYAVVAVYPIAGTDTMTASYQEHANAKPLDRAGMSWFFDHYLRTDKDRMDPRVNLVAADLKGLPPVTIINAEIDPLLTEGEMLAKHLRTHGNNASQRTFRGVTHEFFGMGAVLAEAREANQMAGGALRGKVRQ